MPKDYPKTPLYYEHPVQVRYWDNGLQKYVGGIGYQDFIICGCCGKICSVAEIIKEGEEIAHIDEDEAIIELDWLDISCEIIGE